MAKTKTTYTGENVTDFINSYVDNEQKKADSFRLIELMQEWSSAEAEMWGLILIAIYYRFEALQRLLLSIVLDGVQQDHTMNHHFLLVNPLA